MKRTKWIKFLIFSTCLLIPHAGRATCTRSDVSITLPASIMAIRDMAIGDTLATGTATYTISCNTAGLAGSESSWTVNLAADNSDYGASTVSDVRNTNYPGIGIKWRNFNEFTGSWQTKTSGMLNDATNQKEIGADSLTTFIDEFTLVKTGDVASGTWPGMSINLSYQTPIRNISYGHLYTIFLPGVTVRTASCTVMSSVIAVDMGTLYKGQFRGIGSTAGTKSFSIPLSCDPSTPINISFEGNSDDMQNGVLKLSGGSTASGVGIQLMYNDVPLALASAKALGTYSGTVTLPFAARYYQAESVIKAGTVNATANFTLTYH